jgi:hypothetical protein
MSSLRQLEVVNCTGLTDTSLHKLCVLTQLTRLALSGCCKVTNLGIASIARAMQELRALDLSGCHAHLSEAGVQSLRMLRNLTALDLRSNSLVQDADVAALVPHTPHLQDLNLRDTSVTNATMQAIAANLPCLTLLNVEYCHGVTDKGIGRLTALHDLRMLRLYGTQVTDGGLQQLSSLKSVTIVLKQQLWWVSQQ